MQTYLSVLLLPLSSFGGPGLGHLALMRVAAILRHGGSVEVERSLLRWLSVLKSVEVVEGG